MEIQRLRNLTTGRLHTDMSHIYQDIDYLTGMEGVMTHMLPNVMKAMKPWLVAKIEEARFWDGEYDTAHTGEFEIEPMNEVEQEAVKARYLELPHPFAAKQDA